MSLGSKVEQNVTKVISKNALGKRLVEAFRGAPVTEEVDYSDNFFGAVKDVMDSAGASVEDQNVFTNGLIGRIANVGSYFTLPGQIYHGVSAISGFFDKDKAEKVIAYDGRVMISDKFPVPSEDDVVVNRPDGSSVLVTDEDVPSGIYVKTEEEAPSLRKLFTTAMAAGMAYKTAVGYKDNQLNMTGVLNMIDNSQIADETRYQGNHIMDLLENMADYNAPGAQDAIDCSIYLQAKETFTAMEDSNGNSGTRLVYMKFGDGSVNGYEYMQAALDLMGVDGEEREALDGMMANYPYRGGDGGEDIRSSDEYLDMMKASMEGMPLEEQEKMKQQYLDTAMDLMAMSPDQKEFTTYVLDSEDDLADSWKASACDQLAEDSEMRLKSYGMFFPMEDAYMSVLSNTAFLDMFRKQYDAGELEKPDVSAAADREYEPYIEMGDTSSMTAADYITERMNNVMGTTITADQVNAIYDRGMDMASDRAAKRLGVGNTLVDQLPESLDGSMTPEFKENVDKFFDVYGNLYGKMPASLAIFGSGLVVYKDVDPDQAPENILDYMISISEELPVEDVYLQEDIQGQIALEAEAYAAEQKGDKDAADDLMDQARDLQADPDVFVENLKTDQEREKEVADEVIAKYKAESGKKAADDVIAKFAEKIREERASRVNVPVETTAEDFVRGMDIGG